MAVYLILCGVALLLAALGVLCAVLAPGPGFIVAGAVLAALGAGAVGWLLYHCRLANRMIDAALPEYRGRPLLSKIRELLDQIDSTAQKRYSEEILSRQAKIEALQSQINPHFLYNTLDSIRGQALQDDAPVVADMAEALSMMFRYSISQTGNFVRLREELRNIDKYLMLQSFRFDNKFEVHQDIREESLLECYIPRLTLQPIVENAIFHGLETMESEGRITTSVYASGERLVVRVSDNGQGIPAEKLIRLNEKLQNAPGRSPRAAEHTSSKSGSGIAMYNVNQRIRLSFGEAYGICVYSTPGLGTDVEILLPLITTLDSIPKAER